MGLTYGLRNMDIRLLGIGDRTMTTYTPAPDRPCQVKALGPNQCKAVDEIIRLHVKNAQSARVIWHGEQEQGK